MDSIKNAASSVANTASGYIYGNPSTESGTTQSGTTQSGTAQPTTAQSGTEPVSGKTGAGTTEEPYDKGNEESSADPGAPGSEKLKTGLTGVQDESVTASTGSLEDQYVTGNKRYRGGRQVSYFKPETGTAPKPSETAVPEHGTKMDGANPSTGADPASGQQPIAKQQGGDKPTDVPTGEQEDAVKDKKDEGEEAMKKRDPNDHSGEPMHMHDGKEKAKDDGEHPGQEGGGKHEGQEGTGEKWIKTSGLQADGGDFDAAQAGAGKEADRLLGEKGIVKDERGAMVDKDGNPNKTDHKEVSPAGGHGGSKVKTLDKLKEKLHIGSKKTT